MVGVNAGGHPGLSRGERVRRGPRRSSLMTILRRTAGAAILILAIGVMAPVHADAPDEVDQSLLVPTTLDSSFAPFVCKARRTGPVCTGERHLIDDWAPADWPCEVPVFGARTEDRWQTRYYNQDYLND